MYVSSYIAVLSDLATLSYAYLRLGRGSTPCNLSLYAVLCLTYLVSLMQMVVAFVASLTAYSKTSKASRTLAAISYWKKMYTHIPTGCL